MIKAKTIKFGDNVDTDQIIPAQYLSLSTLQQMAPHTFEFYENFTKDFKPGDIISGNDNFGCGSSREQAPAVLKERGVSAVIAKSFARIFYRNAINIGLLLVECENADEIRQGDVLEIDTHKGVIRNISSNSYLEVTPLPPFMQEILNCGGIVKYINS
ncbi:3-isopropylmalate dehydratase, small subunit [Desulfosporosinus orientis DSM 765]|uniref:3-isopropylmalate dehydratase, small subunit n=1 Tax=Desulfosporosinus orientis (strain ATCC 19365 / DSM 765 / NCIMB 8382 / VKM B-1628 / Singapore I) TaxID=768706 RepID=G7WG71_DESOD|nr:3-isopropylmalate dehydratase small subunit [Desulfosporosinus orientis]AET70165.1 3-isopropylmalate dehydratase, small subunit [Desulfosporosinus orientis DSM 765]